MLQLATENELRDIIGGRIREHRARLGWTQTDLAGAVGVHQVTVALWEGGRQLPTRVNVELLAEALGITTIKLISKSA